MIRETCLYYQEQKGKQRVLQLAGADRIEQDGIAISVRTQRITGGNIVHADVANKGDQVVYLRSLAFAVDTGFDPAAPARFFKHGYQSWSPSYAAVVGPDRPAQTTSLPGRLSHQSEAERPDDAPERATSELFTIVESDPLSDRFLCGFVGA